jgi:REP element-mobilizing transposase RayT
MARKLRIQYPGAIYHVMNRRDRREAIFADDADRERWLQTLTEACEKTGWEVHAYCVMRNPFHLVIETPQHNLVAGMKWLLSPYCQDCGIDNTGQPLSPSEGAREKPPQLLV